MGKKQVTFKHVGLTLLGCLAVFVAVIAFMIATDGEMSSEKQSQVVQSQQEALSPTPEQLTAGIAERIQKWGDECPFTFKIIEYEKRTVRLNADFSEDQYMTMELARSAADDIVQGALNALIKHGRNPADEFMSVICWTHQPAGEGATGKKLTRVFGRSYYDYNTDSIEWKDYTP
ncbi:hypothetical protein [Halodesulfovibrio aestuarii]|uniref:Uncharacterized protein n=1 Tax=Halodesulfovibrio aestuarii TaxID=126333 RepID=A0ABV4JTX0_9BACT